MKDDKICDVVWEVRRKVIVQQTIKKSCEENKKWFYCHTEEWIIVYPELLLATFIHTSGVNVEIDDCTGGVLWEDIEWKS